MLPFPLEALGGFVALLAPGGGMPVRLRQFGDMDDGGHVVAPHRPCGLLEGAVERRVVPPVHAVDADPALLAVFRAVAEALEDDRDVALGELQLVGHRDAVAVVPDRQEHRRLHDGDGVDRFPESPFGAGGVADGAEGDLVAAVAPAPGAQVRPPAVELRGEGEPDQARHLRRRRREVGRRVYPFELVAPLAVGVHEPRGVVPRHVAPPEPGLGVGVGVGVELREELLRGDQPQGQHQRLVPVIARPEIAGAEGAGQGDLRRFLAVAEDAEFGFPRKDLLAGDDAEETAEPRGAVVLEDGGPVRECGGGKRRFFLHGRGPFFPASHYSA